MNNIISRAIDKMKSKRGQLQSAMVAYAGGALAFFLIVVVVFAVAIASGSLKNSTTDTQAQTVITNGQSGLTSFSSLFSPIGIILGVGLMLTVLVGGLGFLFYQRQNK